MNKTKKPRIRFKGFTDDWEQRKVGDLCYMKGRIGWQGLKSSDFISKGPYCVTGTDFYNGKIQWEKCYHVSEARYNMDPYIQLKPGDLLITKDGTIGKLAFIDNLPGKACLNSHLLVIRPNEPAELSNIYLFQVFSSELFLAYYTQSGTGSTMKSLSQGVISNFKISLPCIDEQKKIGDYLKNVDDLITLHQRKCEKLKIIKKSMIENCFPKNGQKVPKIRFSGFTGDWEQRKLGHIVGRVTRKNKDLVSNLPLTISAQYGLIDQNEFFDKRIASKDVSNYYLIHKGEFAYNKSTSTDAPWGAIKRLDRYENGVLSTLYIIFRILDENQVDSDYLASYYNTALWYKSIRMIAAEGARNHGLLNIAPDDFFETTLMIPRDIAEQKKIGAYLKNLDDLITLHQRKLEKLKKIKKSMLERMFV